jgi:hypothetical protein
MGRDSWMSLFESYQKEPVIWENNQKEETYTYCIAEKFTCDTMRYVVTSH